MAIYYPPGAVATFPGTTSRLFFNGVVAGNAADTTEDTLMSFTVPAGALANVGDTLHVVAGGSLAASTDSKTVRLRIGGSGALASPVGAAVGVIKWMLQVWLTKTASNTQSYVTSYSNGASLFSTISGTLALADTGTLAVAVSGQNVTNSVLNSITCQYLSVDLIRGNS